MALGSSTRGKKKKTKKIVVRTYIISIKVSLSLYIPIIIFSIAEERETSKRDEK
jgi:hypothetical protein